MHAKGPKFARDGESRPIIVWAIMGPQWGFGAKIAGQRQLQTRRGSFNLIGTNTRGESISQEKEKEKVKSNNSRNAKQSKAKQHRRLRVDPDD